MIFVIYEALYLISRRIMRSAIFSSFIMVDRSPEPPAGRRATGRQREHERPARADKDARELLVAALLRAFEQAPPLQATTPGLMMDLATATADIALGRSVILQLKPDLNPGHRGAVRAFLETIVSVSTTLDEARLESAIGKLAEVLLPDELAGARGALASDNLELRDRFITEIPQLTSAEIGLQAGLRTRNPYATAARWKKAGAIFSVQHRGKECFPAFQFREGRPHPTVKKALAALPPRLSAWQRAFWFVSTNGWLADKAPADMLDDPQAVVIAAEREHDEVAG